MKQNLKKMCSYYKNYLPVFFADMFFAMVDAGVALVIPLIVRYITSTVVYWPTDQAFPRILQLGILMLVLLAIQGGSAYFIGFVGHVMGTRIEADMRREIFGHYQKLSFSFFDDQKVGQLLSRVTNDLFDICELMHHGPENIVICTIKILGAFVILFTVSWKLALVAVLLLPIIFAIVLYFNRKMKAAFKKNRAQIAVINAQVEENLSGIRVVKSFANEEIELEKFEEGNQGYIQSKTNNYKYMGGYQACMSVCMTMITVVVLLAGACLITAGMLSITDLVTFLLYINVFTSPLTTLINFAETFQNGYTGFERFMEILNIRPDIEDSPNAQPLVAPQGQIQFCDVSFHYPENMESVLSHVNLTIQPGEYVALVGPSGAGKTTLCSMIPRFYDVTDGQVLVDGKDVRSLQQKSLRDNIGIVQQDVYLFGGSILENIRYGRPDATVEEVVAAAKEANAHDFIMALPNGYETDIGQRGVKLSGGQKQRLSIARVFLKNPPILIFDEATSALDNQSEQIVQESLEHLAKNRTTLVIAHRLSTIRNAQRILVLTEDGIAEQGTHEELLAKGGVYSKLYHQR
jgi:ATP-binding cassette subfamily B protein